MIEVRDLPTINALLNTLATVLLVSGYVLIRMGQKRAHQRVMIAALAASALFLTCYLIYHYQVGSVRFQKTGAIRTVYLAILLTHTVLAAAVPFLAGITVWRAYRRRLAQHRAIARWTLPVWLYVSVTGVIVYLMLYQM